MAVYLNVNIKPQNQVSLSFARCSVNSEDFEALYLHCLDREALLLFNNTCLVSGKLS